MFTISNSNKSDSFGDKVTGFSLLKLNCLSFESKMNFENLYSVFLFLTDFDLKSLLNSDLIFKRSISESKGLIM